MRTGALEGLRVLDLGQIIHKTITNTFRLTLVAEVYRLHSSGGLRAR